MNIWENAVITQKGLSLLSKLAEGNTLKITRAETGEGYVTPGLLNQLTAVSGPKQSLSFRTISYPEQGKCKLPCYLTNAGLSSGYTAKQVGVYATDPDEGEVLFLIVQAPSNQGTVIPSEAEMPGYSAEWSLYFQYGQASNVSVTVDPSNTITRGELDAIIESEVTPEKIGASAVGHTHDGTEIDLYGDGTETVAQAIAEMRSDMGLLAGRVKILEGLLPEYGTEDLEAGVTPLATGKMFLVYE